MFLGHFYAREGRRRTVLLGSEPTLSNSGESDSDQGKFGEASSDPSRADQGEVVGETPTPLSPSVTDTINVTISLPRGQADRVNPGNNPY